MTPRLFSAGSACLILLATMSCSTASPDGEDCNFYPGNWIDVLAITCAWVLVEEGAWQSRVVVDGVFWERIAGFQPLADAIDVDGSDLRSSDGVLGDMFELVLDPIDLETTINLDFGCTDRPGGVRIVMDLSEPPLDGRDIPTTITEL